MSQNQSNLKLQSNPESPQSNNFLGKKSLFSVTNVTNTPKSIKENLFQKKIRERKPKIKKKEQEEQIDKNDGRWSQEEHLKFLKGVVIYGKNWKKIQSLIGTRTSTQARSHAQKYFYKLKNYKNDLLGLDFTKDSVANLVDMVNQIKSDDKEFVIRLMNSININEGNDNLNDKKFLLKKNKPLKNVIINFDKKKHPDKNIFDANNIIKNNKNTLISEYEEDDNDNDVDIVNQGNAGGINLEEKEDNSGEQIKNDGDKNIFKQNNLKTFEKNENDTDKLNLNDKNGEISQKESKEFDTNNKLIRPKINDINDVIKNINKMNKEVKSANNLSQSKQQNNFGVFNQSPLQNNQNSVFKAATTPKLNEPIFNSNLLNYYPSLPYLANPNYLFGNYFYPTQPIPFYCPPFNPYVPPQNVSDNNLNININNNTYYQQFFDLESFRNFLSNNLFLDPPEKVNLYTNFPLPFISNSVFNNNNNSFSSLPNDNNNNINNNNINKQNINKDLSNIEDKKIC